MQPVKVNGVPRPRWERNTFDTLDLKAAPLLKAAYDRCKAVVDGSAWCAVLAGPPGTGKTHVAIAAMHDFVDAGNGAIFWTVPDFLAEIRRLQFEPEGFTVETLIDSLQTDRVPGIYGQTTSGPVAVRPEFQFRRLLVLDDLGTEKPTEFAGEQLYRVLNARSDMELPTIITTNTDPGAIDPRLLSRFASGLVACTGNDYRRRKE